MRPLNYTLATIFVLAVSLRASAQMDIADLVDGGREQMRVSFVDSMRLQSLRAIDYFSPAAYRYERRELRKERNYLEISGGVQGSLTNLNDSWIETSGGDNSVTLLGTISLKHTYTKNRFSLQTLMSATFGYYHVALEEELDSGELERDPVWYKNQDEFQIEIIPSLKMSDNWSYGASVKFRSQFAKGYVSSSSQEEYNLKSDFMSPGYLDIAGGFIYECPSKRFPVSVTLSPVALSAVYVTSGEIRENAQFNYLDHSNTEKYVKPYGVDPYSRSKYEGGFSLQIYLDKKFGKNDFLRYTTTLHSFYGWMSQVMHKNVYSRVADYEAALELWKDDMSGVEPMLSIYPTLRWENKIEIKASKLLTTTLNYQMYYNRAQNSTVQSQTLLSVGLVYTFANKTL